MRLQVSADHVIGFPTEVPRRSYARQIGFSIAAGVSAVVWGGLLFLVF